MDQDLSCRVCGRPASRVHCSTVLACGSCKEFYRRAVRKQMRYYCRTGDCSTEANNQRRCKACRFRKCAALGMRTRGLKLQEQATLEARASTGSDLKGRKTSESNTRTDESDFMLDGSLVPDKFEDSPSDTSADQALSNSTITSPSITGTANHAHVCNGDWDSFNSGPDVSETNNADDKGDTEPNISQRKRRRFLSEWSPEADPLDSHRIVRPCQLAVYASNRQIATTFYAVGSAVQAVFGDQIAAWTERFNRAAKHGQFQYTYSSPATSVDEVLSAFTSHTADNAARIVKFASMLPGTSALDPSIVQACTGPGWKKLVFFTIHHAVFFTPEESHITIGPDEFPLSRQWLMSIFNKPVSDVMQGFSAQFREIGLDEVERYLLLVVVMLELEDEHLVGEVRALHRHYTRVLLDLLKWRCRDTAELTSICKKLEYFFCAFKLVDQLYRQCSGKFLRPPALPTS